MAMAMNALDHASAHRVFEGMKIAPNFVGFVIGEAVMCDAITATIVQVSLRFQYVFSEWDRSLKGAIPWVVLTLIVHPLVEVLVGVLYGVVSVKLTKIMVSSSTRFKAPAVLLVFLALSYFNVRFFFLSGLTTLLTCASVQKRYGPSNLSTDAKMVVHSAVNVGAGLAQLCVCIFIGMDFVSKGCCRFLVSVS